jgi:mono/diheme cytochrome c family protein
MSAAEYETGARRLAPAERARELQRLEQERQREAERERERLAQEAQARQAREAALAARPLGLRLVEARCGACHPSDRFYFAPRGRTTLGWWLTVLRMEALNGARIEPGERAPIVDHLARSYPATPAQEAAEWLLAALLAAGVGWRVVGRIRRRR